MPTPWANLVVGGPYLDETFFTGGHEADFSQPLDGGANANGILGTTPGYSGDIFNFTYPTDGQFKVGKALQFHQNYATGYQYPGVSDQRNREPMHTVHFHGGSAPTPMDFFEVVNGALVMKSRPLVGAETDWGRIKGFAIQENGNYATYGWFAANGGVPADWAPSSLVGQATEVVYFHNMPGAYACTEISTYNRRSMSFGRSEAEITVPIGAKVTGSTDDLRNIETWFPAFWDLEDVPARCDINGVPHDKDTYTPGNPGAGGVLTEFDILEAFGYNNEIEVTTHHYVDGNTGYIQNIGGIQVRRSSMISKGHTPPYSATKLAKTVSVLVTLDRLPPVGAAPGVLCYSINGTIVALYEMPKYIAEPKIIYEPIPELPYIPKLNSDFTVKRLGSQTYDDGNPAYTHFCQIFTTAMSAAFTRSQAVSALNGATAPAFDENETYTIKSARMTPLIDENPDTRAFINYSTGDFGGGGGGGGGSPPPPTGTYNAYDAFADRPNGGKVYIPRKYCA